MSDRDFRQIGDDIDEGPRVGFNETEEPDDPLRLLSHTFASPKDRMHVDLMKDEYTLDEVARLVGTSRDVVLHAVVRGDLKAERAGHDVVCIKHADVVDWLRRRGPEA